MLNEKFTIYGNSDIAHGDENVRLAFYASIGFFIEVAQMLEYNLRKLLCYEKSVKEIESAEISKERVSEICQKYDKYYDDTYINKFTLGILVGELEKEDNLLKDFIKLLKEVNKFRKKIVHSIFQSNIITKNLSNPKTVSEYTEKRIISMTNTSIEINRTIIKIMEEYRKDLHFYKTQVGLPTPQ